MIDPYDDYILEGNRLVLSCTSSFMNLSLLPGIHYPGIKFDVLSRAICRQKLGFE